MCNIFLQRCNLRASFPPGIGIKLPAEVIRTMLDETLSIYMDGLTLVQIRISIWERKKAEHLVA
jgi:hypothetical protein